MWKKVLAIVIISGLVFGAGYWTGARSMDTLIGGYRNDIGQLERNLGEARRDSELIRARTLEAQNAIASGARGLEESLISVAHIGSVTGQIRGLAQAIRDHVAFLRATVKTLEDVNNSLGNTTNSNSSPIDQ